MPIRTLPPQLINQIAAGEVVERPASVVKELLENAFDAQASRVAIEVEQGGLRLLRVRDDGVGIAKEELSLALSRHATSKIASLDDLENVLSMGFRGEALPSIASVSRFRLATREHGALAGTEILVTGGRLDGVRDGGEPPGTCVEVRSLFFNLPARRKFLRAEETEAGHIEHQILLQAVGHPEIGFVYLRDGRVVHQLPPAANLLDRIRDLAGADLVAQLVPVAPGPEPEPVGDAVGIRGYLGKPGVSRANRSGQIVFVNGRAVDSGAIGFALREGYHTALMKGRHPITFLFVDLDPAAVDVNVHPAKREVRFRDPAAVRAAVTAAVRRTLDTGRPAWSAGFAAPPAADRPPLPETPPLIPPREQVALRKDWSFIPRPTTPPGGPASPAPAGIPPAAAPAPAAVPPVAGPDGGAGPERRSGGGSGWEVAAGPRGPEGAGGPCEPAAPLPAAAPGEFKLLGVIGRLYVLLENAAGLVVVDQHAAHERVLFEELRRRLEDQGVPSQRLLLPLTIGLGPRDAAWLAQNTATLHRMGISIEPFGAGTFKIDALPQFLKGDDPLQMVRDIIDELRAASAAASKVRLGEEVIATAVCRHAVKAHDELSQPEIVRLIRDLLACDLPYCCPHGRPTMIQISYAELEKKFGRKV